MMLKLESTPNQSEIPSPEDIPTADLPIQPQTQKHETDDANDFLPIPENYSETMTSPQDEVEANPERFIIPECIPACMELWSKNIYTYMTSDHLNPGKCWIEIAEKNLSARNRQIYDQIGDEETIKFSYHAHTLNFGVPHTGPEGQSQLLALAEQFEMQDVPEGDAYISEKDFLMRYCDCYDEIPNPNYIEMENPSFDDIPVEELLQKLDQYDAWLQSDASHPSIRRFNPEKAQKPTRELAAEHGMILDGDRIYLSEFHYEKHRKYLQYLQKHLGHSANDSVAKTQ